MPWTADDIPVLEERTAVVTGPDSGIGYHVAKQLAKHEATVFMASKTEEKGEEARERLEHELDDPNLTVIECDLASLDSVIDAANTITTEIHDLDILCNNAGVMALPYQETEDGFEYQMGVNHLGHFALTLQLLPLLDLGDRTGRVVTQSSGMHDRSNLDPTELMPETEDDYDRWQAYADSKLANLLFAYELERRTSHHDLDVSSVACHPGYADTNLQLKGPRQEGSRWKAALMELMGLLFAQSPKNGALPMLYGATGPDIDGGTYWGPDGIMSLRGYPEQQESSEQSYDQERAHQLWVQSETLTDIAMDDFIS